MDIVTHNRAARAARQQEVEAEFIDMTVDLLSLEFCAYASAALGDND